MEQWGDLRAVWIMLNIVENAKQLLIAEKWSQEIRLAKCAAHVMF